MSWYSMSWYSMSWHMLQGVNEDLYKTVVLPRTLEQITNCKDYISQEYLMDCLIQAPCSS